MEWIGLMVVDREALRTEALRVHRRYAQELVEAFGFCPWAAAARIAGQVQTRIVFGRDADLEQTLHEVESLEYDESTEIGLIVFPELNAARVAFQHFSARVRALDEQRKGRGRAVFAIADFHPDAEPDLASSERLVAFIRRSPDPTLQLVRRSTLEAMRRGEQPGTRFVDPALLADAELTRAPREPTHQRLARANLQTVQRLGIAAVTAVLDDILRDRDDSYARLGVELPPWSKRAEV
jgi:hypothetical protein